MFCIWLYIEAMLNCVSDYSRPRDNCGELQISAAERRKLNFDEASKLLGSIISDATVRVDIQPIIFGPGRSYEIQYQGEDASVSCFDNYILIYMPRKKKKEDYTYTMRIIGKEIAKGGNGVICKTNKYKLFLSADGLMHYCLEKHPKVFKCYQCPEKGDKLDLDLLRNETTAFHHMHGGTRLAIVSGPEGFTMMMKIDGERLDIIMRNAELSWKDRVGIADLCVKEVMRLHGLAWLHGDIKPCQFLYQRNRTTASVKLIDFGSALFFQKLNRDPSPECLTTNHYAAPEIYQNYQQSPEQRTKFNYKVDVYALGITLIELFIGKHYSDWLCEKRYMTIEQWKEVTPNLSYGFYSSYLAEFIKPLLPQPQVRFVLAAMVCLDPNHRLELNVVQQQLQAIYHQLQ